MDKNTIIRILVEKLENEIRNSLKENLHKNPMAGTPLEGMFLLQIINEECENYRNFLSQSQDKINVTQNEIDIIISTASKNISRQVFDNMDDEDDDNDFQNFNFQDDDFEDDENENIENEKFIISSLFYKFCFSDEVAALFLNDDSHSEEIAQNIKNTTNLSDSASFLMFKAFLRRNNIQINQIDDDRFEYNNFEFDFNLTRRKIENSNNYFEILSNNIENVKNEDGIELAVANNFVIYIENNKPKILCSVINDPYINKYSIRRVQTNGISSSIGFITDNKISTICEKIKEIIPKKEIVKSVNSNPKLNEQFKNYKEGLMSLIGDKNPAKGSDDNKTISFYLGLANKNKAFDFYELVRTNNNGAYFRIHTMNGFSTIAETTSEVIYNDLSKTEWFDLIYKTSMKHFFKEEVKLFKSGYVKQKSGGCLGMIIGLSFILYFAFNILTE
ncbi:hypothetical protein [Flavobacterium celericrescens]|uniref:Uncharacterized protein n=1 Tax=Flavobacterium celericrescens TaxID=2709780 RepID=A0ABX0I949_9FLAO|nr:hypothetical protein [Flavobacterium celericrescens]NHM03666.1 hypothetical protein [Flavobacterium celericrescens]